ncbi:unnamed protein product [Sphenostylis stenocarpa]|uniref:Uncharacterized protein n=1 Tax=Sphenostylis stenocarpa TaxID=92480 RepID=A0AA86V5N8_9FABA|nr:unnamed protein product [Sphenostylis stenocarpa]
MVDISSVDASLWWDSFAVLLTELENSSLSSDLPPNLVKKLKDNHAWFVDTLSRFKPPNQSSKEALNSKTLKIGSHQLTVQPHLRDKALQISSNLAGVKSFCHADSLEVIFYCHSFQLLDEVQSYIFVERSTKHNNAAAADSISPEFPHMVNICSAMHHYKHMLFTALLSCPHLGLG